MDAIELRTEVANTQPPLFVSQRILEALPMVFVDDVQYILWKHELATSLDVDPGDLRVTGSACTGASLNPNKNFKPFDESSDIDVAVVSPHHFEVAWRFMRHLGSKRYALPSDAQHAVKLHVEKYIYWGTITTDRILAHLPFGKPWLEGLQIIEHTDPTSGREVKVRLYRDLDALRGYHMSNITKLRRRIATPEAEEDPIL